MFSFTVKWLLFPLRLYVRTICFFVALSQLLDFQFCFGIYCFLFEGRLVSTLWAGPDLPMDLAGLRLPDVLERQELSFNLMSKLVMTLILEKQLVVLEYFPVSLQILK